MPDALHRFAGEVVAHYRAAAPGTPAEFVYGGPEYAGPEAREAAARLALRLFSFVEYQGLIDFRDYITKQTGRLQSDAVYPPDLYVPQRMEFEGGSERNSTHDALKQVSAWLTQGEPRFILILGEFGTGKTFLLHELARHFGKAVENPISLLIELRALDKAQKLDMLLAAHFARHDFVRFDLSRRCISSFAASVRAYITSGTRHVDILQNRSTAQRRGGSLERSC